MSDDARTIGAKLKLAKQDLEDAITLRGRRNATYLLEQAAEKIILAVLTSEGIHGNIRHKLGESVDAIPDDQPMKAALKEIAVLEAYATTFKYGTPSGRIKPGLNAAEEARFGAAVLAALEAAAKGFQVDLSLDSPVAKTPGKMR